MSPSTSALILVSAVLLLSSATTTSAFNVTLMLDKYPDYTEFNNLLSKTGVADEINRRQTITILALSNGHFGDISSKKDDVQKRIISTHVVLDYYDVAKLKQYNTSKGPLTTLFQTYGQAKEHQGFLNVLVKDGEVYLSSAMKSPAMDSKVESSVASQPYNISILSISSPIIAPGIDGALSPASAKQPNALAPAAEGPAAAEGPKQEAAAAAPGPEGEGTTPADGSSESPSANSAAVKQVVSGVGLIAAVAAFVAGF